MNDPGRPVLDLSTKVRLGFVVVAMLYAALSGRFTATLPWALLVMALDLVVSAVRAWAIPLPVARTSLLWGLLASSALAAGLAFNAVGTSAAALSFIPAYHAGLAFGRLGFLIAALICALSGLLASLTGRPSPYPDGGVAEFVMWIGTTVLLGILGTWSASMAPPGRPAAEETETRFLLQRLREIAVERHTGFDAPTVGSELVERLDAAVPHDRVVVFAQHDGGPPEIVALGGMRRITRAIPADILAQGLRTMTFSDARGDGVALIVPVSRPGTEPAHGVILERAASTPFTEAETRSVKRLAEESRPSLDVALLFEALRDVAVVEERNQLAREMHDGIAQDLAALGFEIDAARLRAASAAPEVAQSLTELRGHLGSVISDLRLRMSDLAMTQRSERGLGALVSEALQRFGSTQRIRTSVAVSEDPVRLPLHVEASMLRALGAVLEDARQGHAASVSVVLDTSEGLAQVEVEHDGDSSLVSAPASWPPALRERLLVDTTPRSPRGVRLRLTPRQAPTSGDAAEERSSS